MDNMANTSDIANSNNMTNIVADNSNNSKQTKTTNLSKLGKGKIIKSQTKEVIYNVYMFMKQEAAVGKPMVPLKKITERVAKSTGVSRNAVTAILKEGKNAEGGLAGFTCPKRKGKKKIKKKTAIDDLNKCVIRHTIYSCLRNNERPTLSKLLYDLKMGIHFDGGKTSLWKVIRQLSFRWRKTKNNKKMMLVEKNDLRAWRGNYLQSMRWYRSEGRPIVYINVSYLQTSHAKENEKNSEKTQESSSSSTNATKKEPQRTITIVHAGRADGFIPNALLMFKSNSIAGDHMKLSNYEKWLRETLIPTLPPHTVIVLNNSWYHNLQINKDLHSNSKKSEMEEWLTKNNIQFQSTMTKPQMYNLIKTNRPKFKTYKIDSVFREHGLTILRLPPFHSDLNPSELIWSSVKAYVVHNNPTAKIDDLLKQAQQKFDRITKEEWALRCRHVIDQEKKYIDQDQLIDTITESVVSGNDDSSSSDSDNDPDMDASDASDSD